MVALHDHVLFCLLFVVLQDLRFWVKPRNTSWFFIFFLIEHKNDRWVENFWMSKATLFKIDDRLCPIILLKYDSNYWKLFLIEIKVVCAIYKLAHGINFLICNEMFVIMKSIIFVSLHEFLNVFSITFKNFICWPILGHRCKLWWKISIRCVGCQEYMVPLMAPIF
jgi:hypothetical protein